MLYVQMQLPPLLIFWWLRCTTIDYHLWTNSPSVCNLWTISDPLVLLFNFY